MTDRLEMIKQTRIGVLILGASALLMIISISLPPLMLITCLSQLLSFIALLGPIVGLIFIARGSKAFSNGQRWMSRIALLFIVVAMIFYFIFMVTSGIINAVTTLEWDFKDGVPGSDIKDLMRMQIHMMWIGSVPAFILMGSYLLGLWRISPDWGRITLSLFIVAALGSMIGGGFITQGQIQGEVDDISSYQEYDEDQYLEINEDIAMKMYTAGFMRYTFYILLIVACISSLLHLNREYKRAYIGD